ncbi:aminoglycoside 6-adenylyltransferase [Tateyamaria omphalii]|uniref:Polymerase nucleotidyl transferase domain-containing protein n=1 Tax=Tateyamaria omphalii TaxID=299262 RepID=A0A1P8MWH4_9RHOB|nr:aminoglycoside 6-adenylyltransferase [Tateyamaria omphalii]APX12332.1 hypothetical protein BWR18_12075 [Tateyamaria omphalii]
MSPLDEPPLRHLLTHSAAKRPPKPDPLTSVLAGPDTADIQYRPWKSSITMSEKYTSQVMAMKPRSMTTFLNEVEIWAKSQTSVEAILLFGSRTHDGRQFDRFSDYDFIIVSEAPEQLISNAAWLDDFGTSFLRFREITPLGLTEWRVEYEDGLCCDFVPVSPADFARMTQSDLGQSALAQGFRVLHDPKGMMTTLLSTMTPPPAKRTQICDEEIDDFLFHCLWSTRRYMRGELWTACWCCDVYLKSMLLRALEMEAETLGDVVMIQGRSLENWISDQSATKLRLTYVCYQSDNFREAIANTIDLYFSVVMRMLPPSKANAATQKRNAVESAIDRVLNGDT